jgi:ADP-ribose pyrophosphatase
MSTFAKPRRQRTGQQVIPYCVEEIRKEWSPAKAPGYPARALVPFHYNDWRRAFRLYNPPEYTADSVLRNALGPIERRYADQADISKEEIQQRISSGKMKSYEGNILVDPLSGKPLNPSGRTGIKGRGAWGKWGPNHAADAMLVRFNPTSKRLEVLLIQRKTGEWALPGGMLNPGETGRDAALRELQEETSVAIPNLEPKIIFEGAVRLDPRDTDNAWAETTLALGFVGKDGMLIKPKAGDDAAKSNWFEINEKLLATLYSNHGALIRMGIERLKKDLAPEFQQQCSKQLSEIVHEPLRTTLQGLKGRIGIFGGTFDPLHDAHIKLIKAAQKWHNLDYVIIVPVGQNPLKTVPPIASNLERLMMAREVASTEPTWFVSPLQIRRGDLIYSADLLQAIKEEVDPSAKLYTLVGADCISGFNNWGKMDLLRKLSTITPVLRNGVDVGAALSSLPRDFQTELVQALVPAELPAHSGTSIRHGIGCDNREIGDALPPSVRNFVREFNLYRNDTMV